MPRIRSFKVFLSSENYLNFSLIWNLKFDLMFPQSYEDINPF